MLRSCYMCYGASPVFYYCASKNVNGNTAVFTYDGTKLLTEQTDDTTKTNLYGTGLIATAGNTANQLISKGGKNFSFKEAAIVGSSGIIDVAGDLGSDTIKKTGSKVVSKVIDTAGDKAGSMAATKAGAKATQKALESSASAGITSNGLDTVSKKVVETTSDSASLYVNKATKKLSDARIGTGYTRGGMKRATKEWREK